MQHGSSLFLAFKKREYVFLSLVHCIVRAKRKEAVIYSTWFNLLDRDLYRFSAYLYLDKVVLAEWLRRWTRNPFWSPRVGSNPADYEELFSYFWL